MLTSKSKNTKRRTKVKELPKKEKKLTGADMKKVKGGATGSGNAKTTEKVFNKMDRYIRG
jgi:hypothetical protein